LSLEAVNPVALGKTRAKQYALLKTSPEDCQLGDKVMCVQIHGDASFAGQGVVMESLGLSELVDYSHLTFRDITPFYKRRKCSLGRRVSFLFVRFVSPAYALV
jgi:hypothetical protein